jgi:nucleotide-binding universal stress UspA family protein
MYDPIKLQERMAELGLNFRKLAQRAKIDPKTAKTIVLTGRGWPQTIQAVAKALKIRTLAEIVKRANVPEVGRMENNGHQEQPPRRRRAV